MIGGDLFRIYTFWLGGNGAIPARPSQPSVTGMPRVFGLSIDTIYLARPGGQQMRDLLAARDALDRRLRE